MVNALSLVKSESFGNVQCDFYSDNKDIWMTREQVGLALEYSEPAIAIGKLHKRYKDRLDKFSVLTKLVNTSDGKQYDTYIYNAKGIYEICRWSRQPKADAFFDWVYDMLEGLRTGKIKIKQVRPNEQRQMELEARLLNSKARQANLLLDVADKFKDYLSKESIQSLLGNATEIISGRDILPKQTIPKSFTASDISKIAGVSRNKIGRIANNHDLKQPEYGLWVLDKSPHSIKQVSTFVYNEAGKEKILEILRLESRQTETSSGRVSHE